MATINSIGTPPIIADNTLSLVGNFPTTFNFSATTNITFPTTGTLATTASTVAGITGVSNRTTITGTSTNPIIDISASYVGQSSITTLGTITTGLWNGTAITGSNINYNITNLKVTSTQLNTIQDISTTASFAVSYISASGAGGGNIQAFINNANTSATSIGGAGYTIKNSDTTTNNWQTIAFLQSNGNIGSIIGQQVTNQGTNISDLAFFSRGGSGSQEGGRFVGSNNTLTLTNPLGVPYGGNGQSSYAIGDILQASASTTLSKLAAVATGNVLISGGTTTISSWGKVGLTTHVSGILPYANGGSNAATAWTQGSILFAGASNLTEANANLFFDATNKRLGIGTFATSPDTLLTLNANSAVTSVPTISSSNNPFLHIVGSASASPLFIVDAFGGGSSYFISRSAQGTPSSPTQILNGYALLQVGATGMDNISYAGIVQASINIFSTQDWTSTGRGTRLTISSTINGATSPVDRITIDSSGKVLFGTSLTSGFDTSGNLGLGTSSPTGLLYMKSATTAQATMERGSTTNEANFLFKTTSTINWSFGLRDTSDSDFHIYSGSISADVFLITTAGNITLGNNSTNTLTLNGVTSNSANTTGGGLVLPALVATYKTVIVNGTTYKSPLYAN